MWMVSSASFWRLTPSPAAWKATSQWRAGGQRPIAVRFHFYVSCDEMWWWLKTELEAYILLYCLFFPSNPWPSPCAPYFYLFVKLYPSFGVDPQISLCLSIAAVPQTSCMDQDCSAHEFCGVELGNTRCLCRAIFASKYKPTNALGTLQQLWCKKTFKRDYLMFFFSSGCSASSLCDLISWWT